MFGNNRKQKIVAGMVGLALAGTSLASSAYAHEGWTPPDGGNTVKHNRSAQDSYAQEYYQGPDCLFVQVQSQYFVHDATSPRHLHLDHLKIGFYRRDGAGDPLGKCFSGDDWFEAEKIYNLRLQVYDGNGMKVNDFTPAPIYTGDGTTQPSTGWRTIVYEQKLASQNFIPTGKAVLTYSFDYHEDFYLPNPDDQFTKTGSITVQFNPGGQG